MLFISCLLRYKFGMVVVGITGGIGAGKSVFTSALEAKAFDLPLIDMDLISRDVVHPGNPAWLEIRAIWPQVVNADGSIDRTALGQIVFQDPKQRKILNQIMRRPMLELLAWNIMGVFLLHGRNQAYIVVPLLFEFKLHWICRKTICISASDDVRIERIMRRDQCSRELALAKIRSQMSSEERERRSTIVIRNDGDLAELQNQLIQFMNREGEFVEMTFEKSGRGERSETITRTVWREKRDSFLQCLLYPSVASLITSIIICSLGFGIYSLVGLYFCLIGKLCAYWLG